MGKVELMFIVLFDEKGGLFWEGMWWFVDEYFVLMGVIFLGDFDWVVIIDFVEVVCVEIIGFWCNYDLLCWVGDMLVLCFKVELMDEEIEELNMEFVVIFLIGCIEWIVFWLFEVVDDDCFDLLCFVLYLD